MKVKSKEFFFCNFIKIDTKIVLILGITFIFIGLLGVLAVLVMRH